MKKWVILLAAAGAFGMGVSGAAWAQAPSTEAAAVTVEKKRSPEAAGDKPVEKKAAARKDSAAAKKTAAAKKDDAERAPARVDADAPVLAAGGVFKCVDRDGNITYGNVGDVKGCKKIDTDTANTVPFPKPTAAPTAARTPGKAEGAAQRARDTDRRRILQEELASEEKKLVELKKEYNGSEPERRGDEKNFAKYQERTEKLKADVARSESNINSLRREISAIRD